MTRIWKRTGFATTVAVLTAASVLMVGGVAHADNIQDSIEDNVTGITLVAGSSVAGPASIRVVANRSGGDQIQGCNIDAAGTPLVLNVVTPFGVTATPNPLVVTRCGSDVPVEFTATAAAVSGVVTVTVASLPATGYVNQVSIPITITQPTPTNTKPTAAVAGVTNGAAYEIGSVPAPTCVITDAEDGAAATATAVVTGMLTNGLGSQTATCDYTDGGGLPADTATATYSIVDTNDPTISYTLDPATPNVAGWYNTPVVVDFICADVGGSGIADCDGDTTLNEGADQTADGTATDNAGNTATTTVSGINIDMTDPEVALVGGPTGDYYFGSDPAKPTCDAFDALSKLASCVISGGGSGVGAQSYTATATDVAGNTSTATLSYTVLAWTLTGFYAPVDMGGVWNTVKGGSTVPLKFEIFAGSTELTTVSAITSFTAAQVNCPGSAAATDAIEFTTTGGTALRYDSTGGQFVQNWATPKKPGACIKVTMTTQDGSSISANFLLK